MKRRNFLTLLAAAFGIPAHAIAKHSAPSDHEVEGYWFDGKAGGRFGYVYRHSTGYHGQADNNRHYVFMEAQLRQTEEIPSAFKLPYGEWLQMPPYTKNGKWVRPYLWEPRWSEILYRRAG
jgi:hypothetical protein